MKIGIITNNVHNNYGNRLQNFALQKTLSQYGECDSLWWSNDYNFITRRFDFVPTNSLSIKDKIKLIFNYHNFQNELFYNLPIQTVKKFQIKKFSDKLINIKQINELNNNVDSKYNFFFAGSDQIWNPNFWGDEKTYAHALFLQFAKKEKRIAYAASFGLAEIPKKYEKKLAYYISSIEHLSVREKAGAMIIKKLTGRDVPVVLDPTLLITSEQWASIEKKPEWYNGEKFILTYFLGKMPDSIVKFAQKKRIKLYNLMDINNIDLFSSRIEEFLYLVHNCEMFFTDSFHGSVFAIQFRKPFIVLKLNLSSAPDMSSRFDTLLETFDLKDRFCCSLSEIKDLDLIMHPNYSGLEDKLSKERKNSINFIENSLNYKQKIISE